MSEDHGSARIGDRAGRRFYKHSRCCVVGISEEKELIACGAGS